MSATVFVHLKDIRELTPQIPALPRVFEFYDSNILQGDKWCVYNNLH